MSGSDSGARTARGDYGSPPDGLRLSSSPHSAALAPLVDSPRLSIHLWHIYDGSRVWDPIPAVRAARAGLREAMA